jgi:hypothetical protein
MRPIPSRTVADPHAQKTTKHCSIPGSKSLLVAPSAPLDQPPDWFPPGEAVKYLPPFELIRRSIEISTVRGELRVNVSYEDFVAILRTMIRGVDVDEAWYARTYEDIGNAVKIGVIRSAKQHFVDDGYFEGRLPFPIVVDERWYLAENPDVAESIRKGVVDSAQDHFDKDGYREGRLPFGL